MMHATNGKNPKPQVPTLVPVKPKPPLPNATEFVQLNYLQKLILHRAGSKGVTDTGLARLAIAFCQLGERKRVLRGIPLPGQLRPDLDPIQLATALKRQRDRSITDIQAHTAIAQFSEEPEAKPQKESIPTQEGDHGGGGGGGKGEAGA